MKNLIAEKPNAGAEGRIQFSLRYVDNQDLLKKNILDIGCGYGWFEMSALNRKIKSITGIEISGKDLVTARKNIKASNATFSVGSAINIPFHDKSFDTVVSWEVIEHLPPNTESKMFEEVYRVLKKGGIFYMSTPYKSIWSMIFDPAWWLINHRHYSSQYLTKLAKDSKFKILNITKKGKWWTILALLNMYASKWILRRKPLFHKFFSRMENEEYKLNNGFVNIYLKLEKNA